jgi:DNA primase
MTNLLDQPLGPTSLIETPETSLGRDDSIDQAEEKLATDDKALRRKIAPLELRHFPKMTGAEKAAHLRLPLTEQLAILQEKDRAAR